MNNLTIGPIPNVNIADTATRSESIRSTGGDDFSAILSNAVHTVDKLHDSAASQVGNLLQGGGGDLNNVMVAVEKADVAFQLMMQVRNKIVSAYQEIERMQF
jgi:flagellar hook-basal body complex protein FliE